MSSSIDKRIGENIRHARSWAGLNQEELGKHLGITAQQVSKFELGSNRVSSSQLVQIAEKLEVKVTDLLTGVDQELTVVISDHTLMRDYKALTPATQATIRQLVRAIVTDTARTLKS